MTTHPHDQGSYAGRSGNDYLQGGGAGYQSWAAEGPGGAVGSGGLQLNQSTPLHAASAGRASASSPLAALLAGVGIGATLMFFLDADRGARRRHLVRDKLLSTVRGPGESLSDVAVDARNRARGAAAEVRGRLTEGEVSDEQLVARVRAELGHHVERARPIEVVADGGVVTLRGPVLPAEVPEVVAAVSKVRGVERVENQLELRDDS